MLIGAFEAGFYPTAVAYLSFFYTRYDLGVRVALFYGQYAIAGAFSASIGVFLRTHDIAPCPSRFQPSSSLSLSLLV